jgi:hypothetical protein
MRGGRTVGSPVGTPPGGNLGEVELVDLDKGKTCKKKQVSEKDARDERSQAVTRTLGLREHEKHKGSEEEDRAGPNEGAVKGGKVSLKKTGKKRGKRTNIFESRFP